MSIEQVKAELSKIPEEMVDKFVGPLMEVETQLERIYLHVKMLTRTSNSESVTEALRLLTEATEKVSELPGYEDAVRTEIQSYIASI